MEDKNNNYRNELRGYFYGSKYPSTLHENNDNGLRGHKDIDYRSRHERSSPPKNKSQVCKQAGKFQTRQDIHRDYIKCQCQDHQCPHGQRHYRAQERLTSNYCHGDCPQSHQYQSNPRIVNESSPRYSPNPLNSKVHFTRNTQNQESRIEKNGEDCLLYKNSTFGALPSSKSEHGDGEVGENRPTNRCSHQHHKKDSNSYLKNGTFQKQFPFSSDESTSKGSKSKPSQATVISAKSGDDLRAAVRSQIEMQEALDDLALEMKAKKEGNAKSVKSRVPNSDPQTEEVVAVVGDHHSNTVDPDELDVVDFSVSADDIVSAKVIDPMIRKIQRMYLNTLKEEMHLMEYLEKVPKLVSEVYKREAAEKEQKKH
ncbi:uncharacterized protein LOC108138703 isoform X2 [Drosophila elegans]|uniref:uncharacterized protein LOC108138703 isoform X2 n=1 Tax=Drosophila elegans TaxID=30023 RepID=UPI0007E7AAAE|nr:uncharacterized protein LOC108138703 isoform X2 [Drosophila elegans]